MGCLCDNIETNKDNNSKNTKKYKGNNKKENKNDFRVIDLNKERKNEIDKKKLKNLKSKIDDEKKKFNQIALKQNNKYRKLHGVEPLELDEYLYKRAFIIAQQYLIEGTFDNEDLSYKNGEELGMNDIIFKEKLEAEKLMGLWYKENEKYNYIMPKELECNNFTQMIWKDSKKFGIGYYSKSQEEEIKPTKKKKKNKNKNKEKKGEKFYCVALYYPAGNTPNKYEENVSKPKLDENYIKELNEKALIQNNKYRQLYGVEPLELDEYLYKKATIIAQQYLIEGIIDENNLFYENEEKLGMNYFESKKKLEAENLMDLWYKEKEKYDYSMPKKTESNNFTQMIWKDSKKFGISFYCDSEDDEKEEEKSKNKKIKDNKNENFVTSDNENISDDVNEITVHPKEKKKKDKSDEKEKNFKKIKSSKKTFYYVALYYPAGNIPGEYSKNVLKPIKDENSDENKEKPGKTNQGKNNAENTHSLIDDETKNNGQKAD